jgi:hypothetical protein
MGNKKKGRRGEVQQEEEGYLSEASIQSSQASGVSVASSSGKKSKRGGSSSPSVAPEVVDVEDVFKEAIGDLEEKRGT